MGVILVALLKVPVHKLSLTQRLNHFDVTLKPLLSFEDNLTDKDQFGILFSLKDYLELVDQTGRIVHDDKKGAIALHLPKIIERLGIDRKTWLNNVTAFEKNYRQHFSKRRQLAKAAS
ncbi:MAG: hypothetical protein P1U47_08995 [Zhongshania sp.]|uniref:hypothetical protein n=1 Tax=Zhongshania sp. TaxID=1971902 RepID=UPI00262F380F|nr:hypothetical protein [Zhongshania sp.]MDF1692495.1 hypothetical protein [Zhongshania sp.]